MELSSYCQGHMERVLLIKQKEHFSKSEKRRNGKKELCGQMGMFLCMQNYPFIRENTMTHESYFCLVKTAWLPESFV